MVVQATEQKPEAQAPAGRVAVFHMDTKALGMGRQD
jgi:hypothetical protein